MFIAGLLGVNASLFSCLFSDFVIFDCGRPKPFAGLDSSRASVLMAVFSNYFLNKRWKVLVIHPSRSGELLADTRHNALMLYEILKLGPVFC